MRENGVHQRFFGKLTFTGDDVALDQLSHFGTDHVRAEKLARLSVEDRLYEAFCCAKRSSADTLRARSSLCHCR